MAKFRNFNALVITWLIFLSSCFSSKYLSGDWQGIGEQVDGKTWQVNLSYKSPEEIKVKYPDLACGGVWGIIAETKKEHVFTEDIQVGKLKCDQGCEVHVSKIDKNKIKLVFFLRYYDPAKPIAEAILSRIQ